jgi:hypothetical protein
MPFECTILELDYIPASIVLQPQCSGTANLALDATEVSCFTFIRLFFFIPFTQASNSIVPQLFSTFLASVNCEMRNKSFAGICQKFAPRLMDA